MNNNFIANVSKRNPCLAICASLICVLLFIPSGLAQSFTAQELVYNNSNWANHDLLRSIPSGPLAAFTTPGNSIHVYYTDVDRHVHQRLPQLYGLWSDEDLTAETGAPPADLLLGVAGFAIQNFQYVFYASWQDNHIHELLYNNVRWSDLDLTATTYGLPVADSYTILAFATTPNNQLHVYYIGGSDHRVHQLFFNGQGWSDIVLPTPQPVTQPVLAGFSVGNYQYVFYEDDSYHLHELYYNNVSWNNVDLTTLTGSSFLLGQDNLAAFVVPGTQTLEVFLVSLVNGHPLQVFSADNKKWTVYDLNFLSGGQGPTAYGVMQAFATTPNNQFHVYYDVCLQQDPGCLNNSLLFTSQIYQLHFNGSTWSYENLSAETGGTTASLPNYSAGFAIGNQQYLFYLPGGNP